MLITNLKNISGIENELLDELKKDEEMFGEIESLKIAKTGEPTTHAFVRYTNRNIHEKVIRHYKSLKPGLYGRAIFFKLSSMNNLSDYYYLSINCQRDFDDSFDDYKTPSNSNKN